MKQRTAELNEDQLSSEFQKFSLEFISAANLGFSVQQLFFSSPFP